jgi:hypothetical protein
MHNTTERASLFHDADGSGELKRRQEYGMGSGSSRIASSEWHPSLKRAAHIVRYCPTWTDHRGARRAVSS